MTEPRIGSVCSGYEGLGMAVQAVLGGELAWVADNDPGATRILAHHYPHVPNLGDITTTDWAEVEPVDIFAAGFPCQDISYSGLGQGIKEGTRSGLWKTIKHAVRVLRPRLLVLENVAGIVTRRPGLDVVAADLAELGLSAEWVCVRASDVGGPHQRNRWFAIAGDPDGMAWAADLACDRRSAAVDEPGTVERTVRSDRASALADSDRSSVRQQPVPEPRRSGEAVAEFLGIKRSASAHAEGQQQREPAIAGSVRTEPRHGAPRTGWGAYAPAIARWEHVLGRPAPRPTEPGRNGDRLSPRFVEWMQGVPAGHVTDVPGLTPNQMLHALGNGVVPLQAAYAIDLLLARVSSEVAA